MLRSALALVLIPALGIAQDLTLDVEAVYAEYDENGDSALDQEEFERMYEQEVVRRVETEGHVEVQQQAMPLPSREVGFRELDVDGDELVSIEELRANPDLTSILGREEQAPRG